MDTITNRTFDELKVGDSASLVRTLTHKDIRRPVRIGDAVTVTLTVAEKFPETHRLNLSCKAVNQRSEEVISGIATVIAPTEKISRPRVVLPEAVIREEAT